MGIRESSRRDHSRRGRSSAGTQLVREPGNNWRLLLLGRRRNVRQREGPPGGATLRYWNIINRFLRQEYLEPYRGLIRVQSTSTEFPV